MRRKNGAAIADITGASCVETFGLASLSVFFRRFPLLFALLAVACLSVVVAISSSGARSQNLASFLAAPRARPSWAPGRMLATKRRILLEAAVLFGLFVCFVRSFVTATGVAQAAANTRLLIRSMLLPLSHCVLRVCELAFVVVVVVHLCELREINSAKSSEFGLTSCARRTDAAAVSVVVCVARDKSGLPTFPANVYAALRSLSTARSRASVRASSRSRESPRTVCLLVCSRHCAVSPRSAPCVL